MGDHTYLQLQLQKQNWSDISQKVIRWRAVRKCYLYIIEKNDNSRSTVPLTQSWCAGQEELHTRRRPGAMRDATELEAELYCNTCFLEDTTHQSWAQEIWEELCPDWWSPVRRKGDTGTNYSEGKWGHGFMACQWHLGSSTCAENVIVHKINKIK